MKNVNSVLTIFRAMIKVDPNLKVADIEAPKPHKKIRETTRGAFGQVDMENHFHFFNPIKI